MSIVKRNLRPSATSLEMHTHTSSERKRERERERERKWCWDSPHQANEIEVSCILRSNFRCNNWTFTLPLPLSPVIQVSLLNSTVSIKNFTLWSIHSFIHSSTGTFFSSSTLFFSLESTVTHIHIVASVSPRATVTIAQAERERTYTERKPIQQWSQCINWTLFPTWTLSHSLFESLSLWKRWWWRVPVTLFTTTGYSEWVCTTSSSSSSSSSSASFHRVSSSRMLLQPHRLLPSVVDGRERNRVGREKCPPLHETRRKRGREAERGRERSKSITSRSCKSLFLTVKCTSSCDGQLVKRKERKMMTDA